MEYITFPLRSFFEQFAQEPKNEYFIQRLRVHVYVSSRRGGMLKKVSCLLLANYFLF